MALREYIEAVNREIKLNEAKKVTFSDSISLAMLSELKGSIRRYLESGNKTEYEYISLRNEWKKLVVEYYLCESGIPYRTKDSTSLSSRTYFVKHEDLQ